MKKTIILTIALLLIGTTAYGAKKFVQDNYRLADGTNVLIYGKALDQAGLTVMKFTDTNGVLCYVTYTKNGNLTISSSISCLK